MRNLAKERKGLCLSEEYNRDRLLWQCEFNHKWFASVGGIKNSKSWCPKCAGIEKHTIEDAKKLAEEMGGKCLSEEYIRTLSKLTWECHLGHRWGASFSQISRLRSWCPKCAGNARLTIEDAKEIAEKRGGECLSNDCDNSHDILTWKCMNSHEWQSSLTSVKHNKTWCPMCNDKWKNQRYTRKVFEKLFDGKFIQIKPDFLLYPK